MANAVSLKNNTLTFSVHNTAVFLLIRRCSINCDLY